LVAHIAGCQATSGGIRGSRPTLGVQALNEGGFEQNFAAYWLSSDPIDCNKRQPIDPAFGQLGSEPAEIVV